MRKLAHYFWTHSGAVLLQIKPKSTEIGAERPAEKSSIRIDVSHSRETLVKGCDADSYGDALAF